MRTLLALLSGFFFFLQSAAQKIPSFGKIDKAEFESKECSYDKEAIAEYLLDIAEVRYYFTSSDFVNETTKRIRIKILNEKAVDFANVRIPYYSVGTAQRIRNIEGYTYNISANGEVETTKLEKKAVMEQKLGSETEMMVFTMPNVKVGSIIEYRFEDSKRNSIEIEDWIFQRPHPVRYSEYNVEIPSVLEFTYLIRRTLPVKESTEGIKAVKRFVMTNIPGLDREPYMSSTKDYLQRIDFQLRAIDGKPQMTTWPQLTEQLLESDYFGAQLRKNVFKGTSLQSDLKPITDPYQRMLTVLNFVKKEVAWNGQTSRWSDAGVKNALEKHSGNSADMNLLLVNLLRDADIKAYPILVSTRTNGKVNTAYPFLYQFNDVYVYAEVDQKPYILDATNVSNPPFITPWDVQFTEGFIVDKEAGQFIAMGDMKHRFRLITSVLGEIDTEGKLNGNANIIAYEYAKNERLGSIRLGEKEYKDEYFNNPHPEFTFDSLTYKNEKNDSLPLENLVHFQGTLNSSGDYLFYSPNFLMELETNDFISDKRFTDIEFGYTQYYNMFTTIRFPNNLEPEELPKNIRMILPDTSIVLQRFITKNENTVSMRYTLEIKRPTYYVDEYLDFKAFYTKLFEMLNEQIVFKRKTIPKP